VSPVASRCDLIGDRRRDLEPEFGRVDSGPEMREHARVRYTVEHFRAIDADDAPLGVAYVSTGRVDEVEAHDESTAAAIALSGETEMLEADVVSYNPSEGLYGVAGEDEAVRVSSAA
jgi:hypothetical protein